MSNVINVVTKIFERIFTRLSFINNSLIGLLINVVSQPYVIIGTCFLVIGFVVGLIKRIIRS